jgi:hypothetical protein
VEVQACWDHGGYATRVHRVSAPTIAAQAGALEPLSPSAGPKVVESAGLR